MPAVAAGLPLSFGPNLEVLSPPEARAVLARHAAAVVALYAEADEDQGPTP
ncbi:hypothetical protein ACF1BU_20530 [Streptomyces sp. NPDC014724]|uniref:hypothetical protein n=1 Tax=unclassified Streptomyces TaxID=2593676 RepID=UPI003702807B